MKANKQKTIQEQIDEAAPHENGKAPKLYRINGADFLLQVTPAGVTLVQVEGPGGYAYEGMQMARLIQSQHLDTVTMENCASACTLLLVAGADRYLGPEAKVGFHRSGTDYFNPSKSWTRTDFELADFYRSRDTSDEFVKQALDTPFNRVWYPDSAQMYAAGYATKRWSERKSGY